MTPTVYDGFIFFNELDALELRFEELDAVVDRFVLVEATTTFTGKSKPLVFAENRERFARFMPKVVHVVVEDMPGPAADAWTREAFQRDAIARGLGDAAPDDVRDDLDVDEIPRADVVRDFVARGGDAAAFQLRFFYYALNCRNVRGTPSNPWNVIVRRRLLDSPQATRDRKHAFPQIADAGWHFSCLGDARAIREKIQAYSHTELDVPRFTDEGEIRRRMRAGLDLFDRPGFEWRFVPIDESFPRYVRENVARFEHLIADVTRRVVGEARAEEERPRRPRILLVYHRDPTTTAAYLETALRRCADVTTAGEGQDVPLPRARVVLPELLDALAARLPAFDAVLEVQGDSVDVVGQERVEIPCGWAIDTHLEYMSYGWHFFRAKAFDHVFVAQKHHVYRYREWAYVEASWLPLAADPDVFRPFDGLPRTFDVGFVGNVLPGVHEARRELLSRILRCVGRVGIARGLWRDDAARFLAGCRLVWNRSLHEDVNMRVFELAACGRPVLTDRLPEKCALEELFGGEEHLLLYDDASLEATIERALTDEARVEKIGAAARAHVLAHHTYDHRAREILRVLGLGAGEPASVAAGAAP